MTINHNKYNLGIGDVVMLDGKYRTGSKVVIIDFTPNKMFATVHGCESSIDDSWQVMTARLTPIIDNENKQK